VEQLLDRGIEGVEISMQDGGCRFHPDRTSAVADRSEQIENKRGLLSSGERLVRQIALGSTASPKIAAAALPLTC
ncbi:hypothetical protein, partial [Mesorhizobium sp. 10.2.3]|uniref:hypothetical protein n=1 Tax=Mesorhizobium sp. 10.2.3 TaxID=1085775 RepID=UPI00198171D6